MADERIINAYKNFLFKFTPFLNTKKSIGSFDVLDDRTVQKYSALRGNFYGELLESLYGANPEIVKKVFSIINNAKYKYEKIKKDIEYIRENLGPEHVTLPANQSSAAASTAEPAAAAPATEPATAKPAATATGLAVENVRAAARTAAAAVGQIVDDAAAGSVNAIGSTLDPPINIQIDFIKILLILALKQFGGNVCYATGIPSDDTIFHFRTDPANIFDTVFTNDNGKYAKIPNDLYKIKLYATFHNSTVTKLFYLLKERLFGKTTINTFQDIFFQKESNKFNQYELSTLLRTDTLPELLSEFVKKFELSWKNTKGEYTTIIGSRTSLCFEKEEKKAATEKMYNLLGYEKKLTFEEMKPNQLQLLIKNILIFAYKNSAATYGDFTKYFNALCYNLTTVNDIYKLNPLYDLKDYKRYIITADNKALKELIDLIITDNKHTCYSKDLEIINSHNTGGLRMDSQLKNKITDFLTTQKIYSDTWSQSVSEPCKNKIKDLLFGKPQELVLSRLSTNGGSPAEEEPEEEPAASTPPSEPPRVLTPTEKTDLEQKSRILKKLLYLATLYTNNGKSIQKYNKDYLKQLIERTIPGKNTYELMDTIEHFDYINTIYPGIETHIEKLKKFFSEETIIFNESAFNSNEIENIARLYTSGTKPDAIRNELIEILKKLKLDTTNKIKEANQVLFKIVGVKSVRSIPITLSKKIATTQQRQRAGGPGPEPEPAPPPRASAERAGAKNITEAPAPAEAPAEEAEEEEAAKAHAEDPMIGPNIDKVDLRDRGIFVVLLFIIRALALFMTEWAVYSGYVNTFSQTFNMYFGVYLCIFILILILTNVKSEISFFEQAFYYVNAEAENGKGTLRIILQLMCIIFILPIPYMVKDFRLKDTIKTRVLTYTEKSNIYYSVEKFSLYTWILTCVFALIV